MAGCNTLSNMKTVTLRNTSHFPEYGVSAGLIDTCSSELIRSNKRTVDKVITVWNNTMTRSWLLWLWHHGEVREINCLAPNAATNRVS